MWFNPGCPSAACAVVPRGSLLPREPWLSIGRNLSHWYFTFYLLWALRLSLVRAPPGVVFLLGGAGAAVLPGWAVAPAEPGAALQQLCQVGQAAASDSSLCSLWLCSCFLFLLECVCARILTHSVWRSALYFLPADRPLLDAYFLIAG